MGLFDIFSTGPAEDAAAAQIAGLNAANAQGQNYLSQGLGKAEGSYAAGLAPLNANQASNTAGVNQLQALLGIGGPGGAQGGQNIQALLANLPGYQFALNQGTQNVERSQAAQGMLSSGNTDKAIADYTTGLANQNYGNYVSQLQPFLGAQTTTGGQIAATNAGLAGLQNQNLTTAANMAYGTQAGIGNANASADLARYNASGNMLNAGMQGLNLAGSLFGML